MRGLREAPDGRRAPMAPVNDDTVHVSDPWLHRTTGMRCHSCMYFVPKDDGLGRCRRHAPTMGGYPVVTPMDWCGDHKLASADALF